MKSSMKYMVNQIFQLKLKCKKLRWSGQIQRMNNRRIKRGIYEGKDGSKKGAGRPRQRCQDNVEEEDLQNLAE